jgi:hypothetical protein
MIDKLLYRIWVQPKQQTETLQLIIPHKLQTAFIVQCHDRLIGGHLDLKKTFIRCNDGHTFVDGVTLPNAYVDSIPLVSSIIG